MEIQKICGIKVGENRRIKIRTNARKVTVNDYENQIKSYIIQNSKWDAQDIDVYIDNGSDTLAVYQNYAPAVSVTGLSSEYPRGNEVVYLKIIQGTKTLSTPVVCRIKITTNVVTATEKIGREENLSPSNCQITRMDITKYRLEPYIKLADIQNTFAIRTIASGAIINHSNIKTRPIIEKNDAVSIVCKNGAVSIAVQGIARESGSMGEKIWVENALSHKLIRTKITGSNSVEIPQSQGGDL